MTQLNYFRTVLRYLLATSITAIATGDLSTTYTSSISRLVDSAMGLISTEGNHRSLQFTDIVRVTKLVLVNTDTKKDIMELVNGSSYDVKTIGATNITIRAETSDKNGCGWVVFILDDGKIEHTDLNAPFSLVGNNTNGSLNPSSTLKQIGKHTLLVQPATSGAFIPDPSQQLDLPVVESRPNFHSCWTLDNLMADEPTVVTESALALTLQGIPNARRHLANSERNVFPGRRRLQTESDGSMYIEFHVENGRASMAPTAAPVPITDTVATKGSPFGLVQGTLETYEKITIGFVGPLTTETKSSERGAYGPLNTFQDFRVDVTFTHLVSNKIFVVPGYFDLDGNSPNFNETLVSEITTTNLWVAHFVPFLAGEYSWTVRFRKGTNCAANGGGDPAGFFDGASGSFRVEKGKASLSRTDLRNKGKLQAVDGETEFKFALSGEAFNKAGPDFPDNFLDYSEYDGASKTSKTFAAYIGDYKGSGYTWAGGKGKGIIGAINYSAAKGTNLILATALTTNGVNPLVVGTSKVNFDCSKLAQWGLVFDWAAAKGVAVRFKFTDTASESFYDTGVMKEERKTFMREMIARFGYHLAIMWDLGEETTNVAQLKERANFIKSVDPYNSPIVTGSENKKATSIYGLRKQL